MPTPAAPISGPGMGALGAALAQGQGGGPTPPGGAAPAGAGAGAGPAGAGVDAQLQMLKQGMGAIRELSEDVKLIAEQFPTTASTAEQIKQLLKQMIIEMAPEAPAQTGSSLAVPGGGAAP